MISIYILIYLFIILSFSLEHIEIGLIRLKVMKSITINTLFAFMDKDLDFYK